MRKNNDGYVIIYVIFVILFLCIVAIGTCSSALSNLQSQNEAVVQMKEKYAAEGEIEMLVADKCMEIANVSGRDTEDPYGEAFLAIESILSTSGNGNKYTWEVEYLGVEAEVEFVVSVMPKNERKFYRYKDDHAPVPEGEAFDPEKHEEVTIFDYTVSVTSQYSSYTTGGAA